MEYRYLLFAGWDYDRSIAYGWGSYIGSYTTLDEARKAGYDHRGTWYQVVDIETRVIVGTVKDDPRVIANGQKLRDHVKRFEHV